MLEDLEHEITALEEAIVKLTRRYREQIEHRQSALAQHSVPNRSLKESTPHARM